MCAQRFRHRGPPGTVLWMAPLTFWCCARLYKKPVARTNFTELNFHLFWRWSCILASYCCFSLAMCKSYSLCHIASDILYVPDGRCQRRRGAGARAKGLFINDIITRGGVGQTMTNDVVNRGLWVGLCAFTGRCKRLEEVYPCFINLSIQTSQEYKTALTSQR